MQNGAGKAPHVRVLLKTLDILEAIKRNDEGVALAELSRTVQMPRATVYRILTTLESRGYLDRRPDGTYRMASKLFALQRDQSVEQELQRAARPHMEALASACKETVNLGTLDGGEVVVIETVESPLSIRMASKIGNRRYAHSTAIGKVLLAGMNDKEVERFVQIKGLIKQTSRTVATRAALMKQIREARRVGFAVDDQENEMDGRCVAAAIRNPAGVIIAALSISAPVFRMDMDRLRALRADLAGACERISGALRR